MTTCGLKTESHIGEIKNRIPAIWPWSHTRGPSESLSGGTEAGQPGATSQQHVCLSLLPCLPVFLPHSHPRAFVYAVPWASSSLLLRVPASWLCGPELLPQPLRATVLQPRVRANASLALCPLYQVRRPRALYPVSSHCGTITVRHSVLTGSSPSQKWLLLHTVCLALGGLAPAAS